jgi:gliding motility-associated-like protein
MKRIITILNKYYLALLLLVVPVVSVFGQTIVINSLSFTNACAGELEGGVKYNEYSVTFTSNITSGTFKVEMSDGTGFFGSTPLQVIAPISAAIVASGNIPTAPVLTSTGVTNQYKITFGVPKDPTPLPPGLNYKLRVINNSVVSQPSATFFGAYKAFIGTFPINNGSNSAAICGGSGSLLLAVSAGPTFGLGLKYRWYKDGVQIPGQNGESITVTTSGVYYAVIDYGNCTTAGSNDNSQSVTVTILGVGETFSVFPASANICAGSSVKLTTAQGTGYQYQWLRNGETIPGANSFEYEATEAGEYKVNVNTNGACSGISSNAAIVTSEDVTASFNFGLAPVRNIIEEGETKILTVSNVNITNPIYNWFQGATPLPNGSSDTYSLSSTTVTTTVTTTGNNIVDFRVVISGSKGSCTSISKEFPFTFKIGKKVTNIPNVISPNNDGYNDTWMIPQEFLNNTAIEVKIINYLGNVVLTTNNYQNDWPTADFDFKSVNPIYYYTILKDGQELKKGSITVVK